MLEQSKGFFTRSKKELKVFEKNQKILTIKDFESIQNAVIQKHKNKLLFQPFEQYDMVFQHFIGVVVKGVFYKYEDFLSKVKQHVIPEFALNEDGKIVVNEDWKQAPFETESIEKLLKEQSFIETDEYYFHQMKSTFEMKETFKRKRAN